MKKSISITSGPSSATTNIIIGELLSNQSNSISMHALAKNTSLSYVTVHNAIPYLEERGIVKTEKKGKGTFVSNDFEKIPIEFPSGAVIEKRKKFLLENPKIYLFLDDLKEKLISKFYILLLFGSYAKGEAKKGSDVDLLFIVPDKENKEEYRKEIIKAVNLSNLPVDYQVVTISDFKEMLNQKYTVGREAFLNNIVLYGSEQYYSLVKEYVKTKGY